MKYKKTILIFLVLTFFSTMTSADIYRSVDENGAVIYSDQPTTKSEAVSLPAVNIATPTLEQNTDSQTNEAGAPKTAQKKITYTQFKILSPKDQETFQNATEIPVTVSIRPGLQTGDQIQYFLDGKAVSEPIASTTYAISKISGKKEVITRGTHSITAELFDAEGNKIKTTASITIYAHYPTLFSPARTKATP